MSDTEGSLRLLTPGEIALARTVFGSSITYPHVWIHHASYFPFKLQGRNTAMSPNGELYFRDWYCEDFSTKSFQHQHLFIHDNVTCLAVSKGCVGQNERSCQWLY